MTNSREISVRIADQKLYDALQKLKDGTFEERQLYKFIDRATDHLKENPFCGIKIPKRIWTRSYIKKFSITNLWKYDLANGWRLIYTIEADEVRIISVILEWCSHPVYQRRFGY